MLPLNREWKRTEIPWKSTSGATSPYLDNLLLARYCELCGIGLIIDKLVVLVCIYSVYMRLAIIDDHLLKQEICIEKKRLLVGR